MARLNRHHSGTIAATILAFAYIAFPVSIVLAEDAFQSLSAALFAQDEDVLADNIASVTRHAATLPPVQRFDYLADWVLPSTTHFAFRMNAAFTPTDPIPVSGTVAADSSMGQILSPVFGLIAAANQTGRLDELRQRVEAIPDPTESHQLRAKLALRFMVYCAQDDSEPAAVMIAQLAQHVKTRGANHGIRWWPETLALAYGMQHDTSKLELLDLATSIYHLQIGQSQWSGVTAWDNFIAGCYAQLSLPIIDDDDLPARRPGVYESWASASVVTAESRGNGFQSATWRPNGNTVHKVTGHNSDYLYFPVPLTGNFEMECDVTSFNYRETQLAYAGVFASPNWRLNEAEIGEIRQPRMLPLDPPITYPGDWFSSRIAVKDGVCRHFVNGRLILQRTLPDATFPWLALRANRLSHGSIRNLTITGTPVIPKAVRMMTSPELEGWFSYFGEPVSNTADKRSWLCEPESDGISELSHKSAPELSGTAAESLLMYHRPMMEDGVIDYEFLYVPGQTIVHPALDRLVFLLEPNGVQTHWVTDGQFQCGELSPKNHSDEQENRRGATPLPLQPDSWNQLQFAVVDDVVKVRLNGSLVFERVVEPSDRRQFGLFHFVDESDVHVRNIRWTGNWPQTVESMCLPPSVRDDIAEIDLRVTALPESVQYDFRNSWLPEATFTRIRGPIVATKDGVVTECFSEGKWKQSDLQTRLQAGGDFDLRASFRGFGGVEPGVSGIQLMATLDVTGQEIRISRYRDANKRQELKAEISVTDRDGKKQHVAKGSICEAVDGTLRLVRLGSTLYYLIAENDSRIFRLVATDDVGVEDLRLGDLAVSAFADGGGQSRVTWTDLSIKAEKLSGMGLVDFDVELERLNQQRDELPVSVVYDFEKQGPDGGSFARWGDQRPWNAADNGLKMESEGSEGWVASGLGTRQVMDGDFDVTLTLDPANVARPTNGRYSSILWQVQLQEDDRMRLASIFMRTPDGYQVIAQKHRTLPTGIDDYSWHGGFPLESVASLRVARRGTTYTMLARPKDSEGEKVIFQTDHSAGPAALHCLLHTGAVREWSNILLKSIEIHAGKYGQAVVGGE